MADREERTNQKWQDRTENARLNERDAAAAAGFGASAGEDGRGRGSGFRAAVGEHMVDMSLKLARLRPETSAGLWEAH